MKYTTLLMFAITVFILVFISCASKVKVTPKDLQLLEDAKTLFQSQFEKGMHPVIWAYIVERIEDPNNFRLEKFEYEISRYLLDFTIDNTKSLSILRAEQTYVPAYRINMKFGIRIPGAGSIIDVMSFYLLGDKTLVLPNRVLVSLSK